MFESPFHGQPRAEGPRNFGNITNTRVRLLDAIPFNESFRFDMEIWHWAATTVDYAVTTYWYGMAGVRPTVGPMPDEAVQPVKHKTDVIIPGFKLLKMPAGTVELQNIRNFGRDKWKDDDQLWWQHAKPGDKLDLGISVEKAGRYAIVLNMTKAPDYAMVQFHVNGKKAGEPVDFYFPSVQPAEPITLGPFDFDKGDHKLSIEIVGANERARKGFMVGIDQIQVKPIK
ncbi:MAG TPA: hypothetical protein DD670_00810 [Planctomycetaceae bacterium]|nr:hypothetical protein [Planctomycetaceae bacterium]